MFSPILEMKAIHLFLSAIAIAAALNVSAADPMATDYSFEECQGSAMPYPSDIKAAQYPDSLVPVFINHVGRHGARYPASAANSLAVERALKHADSLGTITPLGRKMMALNKRVMVLSEGRWGALDSLGEAEQEAIATRMFYNYAEAFGKDCTVEAISSYSPRAMMSMFAFTHRLDRLNNRLTFNTSTGRTNSLLMRPFDIDKDYIAFRKEKPYKAPYDEFLAAQCPLSALKRVLGENYPFGSEAEARDLALAQFHVVAGLSAMGQPSQMSEFFSKAEANALWSCFNLKQYLQRTATTLSQVPADIASALLLDLISTTDAFVTGENTKVCVRLRFGHAETLLPLFSLMRLPGCNYLTNYFDTVAGRWRNFDIVPMAANLQLIVFKSVKSGRYYVRVDLNEQPVALRDGDIEIYYPWGELRRYLMNCVPLYAQ